MSQKWGSEGGQVFRRCEMTPCPCHCEASRPVAAWPKAGAEGRIPPAALGDKAATPHKPVFKLMIFP